MLSMLLRFVLFLLIARAALALWRLLTGGPVRRSRPDTKPQQPAPRAKPPVFEGKIVDVEFEDVEKEKRS